MPSETHLSDVNITTKSKPESVFSPLPCFSMQAQIIAQAIGQAFGVAYQQFLQASGIKASDLRPGEYSDYLESQELYNGDLAHFSDSQNLRDVSSRVIVGFLPKYSLSCYACVAVVTVSHSDTSALSQWWQKGAFKQTKKFCVYLRRPLEDVG